MTVHKTFWNFPPSFWKHDHVLRDVKELRLCFPLGHIFKWIILYICKYCGCMCNDVVLQERVLCAQVDPGNSNFAGESARDPGEDPPRRHQGRGAANAVQRV